MKKLIDYQEEIHKCSKCGLCQSVCPVFEETGNDCSVSRGKFIMLGGIVKGDLALNKNVNKYLDMCLKCNACKDFCPSNIEAREIFLSAKAEYFGKDPNSKFIKLFQSKTVFSTVLNLAKIASNTYRFFKVDKIVTKFYPVFYKMGELGKRVILANEFVSDSKQKPSSDRLLRFVRKDVKVVYFKGCVNEFINPSVKNAAEKILSQVSAEVLPIDFECCGVPFLSSGNAEQFKKQAIFNLSQITDDFDYFLTDCASCQNAFKEYKKVIDDADLLKKIDKILEKSLNINEFLANKITKIKFAQKTSVTFHQPCHLENSNFIEEVLKKSENIEYIQMKDFDKCCGFSGEFAIKNSEISAKISKKKAKNALDTKSDYILTACPSCKLGIVQGLIENKKSAIVLNFVEFLAMADEII